jgi:hypothetical protein
MEERFSAKVDRSSGPDACWTWTASHDDRGRPQFRISRTGGVKKAHRIAWELKHGPVPEGRDLHHLCENRRCVNPAHLVPARPGEHDEIHAGQLAFFGRAA